MFLYVQTNVCYNGIGDAMKVERIEKTNNGRYKMILDSNDSIITYDDVILKNNLLYHKNVDSSLLKQISCDTQFYDIYNKIIKMISTKYRSEKEIKMFLSKTSLISSKKEEILKKLRENGFINDKRFALAYVNDHIHLSLDGPELIEKKLLEYGISSDLIKEVIDSIDDEIIRAKIVKYISKKIKSNTKYSKIFLKQSIMSYLTTRGYSIEMINEVFESLFYNDLSIVEREYQRQYKRLVKKYDGDVLFFKIKGKLLSKGFKTSEIELILKKNRNDE